MADTDLSSIASSVTSSFTSLSKLVTGSSYLAGLGFSAASIAKFKAHKDNPTSIEIGTPGALTALSSALIYLPSAVESGSVSEIEEKAKSAAGDLTSADVTAAETALKDKLS